MSATRGEEGSGPSQQVSPPATQPPASRVAARPKPAQPAVPEAKPAAKKPFSMSYDGVTTREHIAYRISRGAR
jgi:hypothetical protein